MVRTGGLVRMNCSNDAVRGRQRLNNDSNDAKDEYALTRHHVLCRPARGCVSNSDDPCEKVWSDVGEADGKLGFAGDRVAFHQTQCGEKVDVALWELGRQKGLAWYCRPEHLYLAGRSGEEYRGVCPNDVQARRLFEQGRHGWTDQ